MATVRVVFSRAAGVGATAAHTDLQSLSLYKRPARGSPAAWFSVTLGALAAATAVAAGRRRSRRHEGRSA